ncbi:Deoxyribonuclease-1 [Mactra antiquata]
MQGVWLYQVAATLALLLPCIVTSPTNTSRLISDLDDSPLQAKAFDFLPHVLRIGAFNIQTFGRAKMSDPFVAGIIRDVERRNNDERVPNKLMSCMPNHDRDLMRATARLSRVQVVDFHQYNDAPTDRFEREPFSVRVRPIGGNWDFALSALHAKPADAVIEIGELLNVYNDLRNHWKDVPDIILMGDFNADCSYAKESDLSRLQIYYDSNFYWPLGTDADTTTSTSTTCAYDRFVIVGPNIRPAFIPGSEDIYRYELTHNLNYEQVMVYMYLHYLSFLNIVDQPTMQKPGLCFQVNCQYEVKALSSSVVMA